MNEDLDHIDLITLIIIVILVCFSTFTCTVLGRYFFDKYCHKRHPHRQYTLDTDERHRRRRHPTMEDVEAAAAAAAVASCRHCVLESKVCSSARPKRTPNDPYRHYYHHYHQSRRLPALNYAALLAADRADPHGFLGIQQGSETESPSATELCDVEKQKQQKKKKNGSVNDTGTFRRLGIRRSGSGKRDLLPLAQQLENKNLSPIHLTPPESHFSKNNDLLQVARKLSPFKEHEGFSSQKSKEDRGEVKVLVKSPLCDDAKSDDVFLKTPTNALKRTSLRLIRNRSFNRLNKSTASLQLRVPNNTQDDIGGGRGGDSSEEEAARKPLLASPKAATDSRRASSVGEPGSTGPNPIADRKLAIATTKEEADGQDAFNVEEDEFILVNSGTNRTQSMNNVTNPPMHNNNNLRRIHSIERMERKEKRIYCAYCGQALLCHLAMCHDDENENDLLLQPRPAVDGQSTDQSVQITNQQKRNALRRMSSIRKSRPASFPPRVYENIHTYVNVDEITEEERFVQELEQKENASLTGEAMFEILKNSDNNRKRRRQKVDVVTSVKPVVSPGRESLINRGYLKESTDESQEEEGSMSPSLKWDKKFDYVQKETTTGSESDDEDNDINTTVVPNPNITLTPTQEYYQICKP